MGQVYVDENSLSSIGNAIRNITGTANNFYPNQMGPIIENIEMGNANVNNTGTAFMTDILQGQIISIPPLYVGSLAYRTAGYFKGCSNLKVIDLVPGEASQQSLFSEATSMDSMFLRLL